jgi:sorbitol-specific phosphotransferase system component IIA
LGLQIADTICIIHPHKQQQQKGTNMQSGMNTFQHSTEVTEVTEAIQKKLNEYGEAIKAMEAALVKELANEYPEYSKFNVYIANDNIKISSSTNEDRWKRISVTHTN